MRNGKIRVMIVDDHIIVRNGVRLMLGTADDIEVVAEAETAEAAMAAVHAQAIDVALIDIALPDKNGLDLLKAIRNAKPRIAVLMLSMYAEQVYAVRALKLGAAGYLTKNTPAATIAEAVRKAAAGGRHVSSTLTEQLASMIADGTVAAHETLSHRELEVLKLLAAGESLVRIAEMLHLSPSTVTTYRARILSKTGTRSNVELTRYALETGILM
ncbi:response regulator [Noviherbaspirillum pedocola]|nr:response regulator transcription factor [Noviherbaspirillum pedocola]